ncbi:MFS transporter [Pseudonocardia tropica]|jgi:MHS family shikimate/dehydroshikimate transporter-like MFS transporter|uniref:MHS family shikimate/dehydroshikimate transporter-like MFS transporter n=2 Tax=Pseudonocardia TaxID=1847 RepID=A0ABS4W5W8_9PSEU|nr:MULTISPECIES: MFS transporter [Pseudonocardia]MBP2371508.1 MHS family shikimate/dehydroshikimate transporter-like MFS transporter [Pseudonocardia parietis]OLM09215.1 permease of the major facilitator superfamily [Pseudonocardia sp. Ae707_Ps1]
MTGTPAAASPDQGATRRRVLISSTIGSTIEWYDFYLYSTAAALVLGPLFLPASSPTSSTLAAFGTYAAGFVARPIGGLVAGHFGDRIGRKTLLVATVVLMGAATVGIGLLPTYAQIGIWAPILLITLRILQGLAVGGEWGGAVLLAVEHAPPGRQAFFGSWPQMGFPAGLFLGTVAFSAAATLPDEQFYAWGWRLPFLVSVLLVGLGLFIRLRLDDGPAFAHARSRGQLLENPLLAALRRYPRRIVAGSAAALGHGTIVTLFTVWLLSVASGPTGEHRSTALLALMIAAAGQCLSTPAFGTLCDRIGYRSVMLAGLAAAAIALIPGLLWVPGGSLAAAVVTFLLAMTVGHGAVYAGIAGLLATSFPTEVRFSAVSTTYQLGSTVSSFVPLVAAALATTTGGFGVIAAIALFVAAAAAAAIVVLARSVHSTQPAPTGADMDT